MKELNRSQKKKKTGNAALPLVRRGAQEVKNCFFEYSLFAIWRPNTFCLAPVCPLSPFIKAYYAGMHNYTHTNPIYTGIKVYYVWMQNS